MKQEKVNKGLEQNVRTFTFEPLIKVELAATMLGLEANTLYQWIGRGQFEGFHIGKKAVRVRPEAVRAFLDAAKKDAEVKAA